MLDLLVDAEQRGVLPADAQDDLVVVERNPEVPIRDPAPSGSSLRTTGEQPLGDGFGLHAARS